MARGPCGGEAEGFTVRDPMEGGAFHGVACLVTSPGIPHLYPAPHRAIAAAMVEGIPVDNDIGLFFRSLGQGDWADHDTPPRVVAVTGTNGKSTTAALIAHVLGRRERRLSWRAISGAGCWTSTRRAMAR
jgi:UDP-N-acetylmuramoylalanine--D-glutamate ligase